MKTRIQQGFTLIELLVVITIIAILASLAVPAFAKIQERGQITKGISNCKNIILSMRLYSTDNNGMYPDQDKTDPPGDSNAAFRLLFKEGSISDERIFGCQASKFNPDGNIGESPEFTEALEGGENHWAMLAGLNDTAPGPIVFENPSDKGGGNPSWDADSAGKSVKGRTWSSGKIIVGLNDASVNVEKCAAATGTVKLKDMGDGGKNLFTMYQSGTATSTVLDIVE